MLKTVATWSLIILAWVVLLSNARVGGSEMAGIVMLTGAIVISAVPSHD